MIQIQPATPDRFDDLLTVLGATGEPRHCLCQYWRLSSSDYSRTDTDARTALLRNQMASDPPPGLIAYLEGEPAGWIGFGPRPQLERLVRSRTIPKVDDLPVWSAICFTVRVGFRRRGIAHALLKALVDYARAHGAPALEAYAVDTGGRRIHGTAAYVGTTSMFEACGFQRIVATDATSERLPRWLMRLDLRREG